MSPLVVVPMRVRWLVLLLLGIILTLDVMSIRRQTLTYDEDNHFRYGQNIVNLDSTRVGSGSKMPFSAAPSFSCHCSCGRCSASNDCLRRASWLAWPSPRCCLFRG